ncbi:transthyretin-like family protein [Brumimicrobium mesophilum]|uniref:hypothetical protein n=1 Tax=Brumimicrobium mesophilum TaxID=392717 RepID=UPI000D140C6D|nr:hypothetical protein [Brumimicrobium mesophilum]
MAHKKINYVLILFLAFLLFTGCKKKSKEYTTVIWEVINPVTNEPYTNMLVRLYEAKKKNNGIEYNLLFEGKTNQVGIAEFSFKANLTSGYWYEPEINEGSLGHNGFDYSVLKQPSPSDESVKKDEENIIRYEIVHIVEYVQHTKNINCQGSNDRMRFRRKFVFTGNGVNNYSAWIPNINHNGFKYLEGCYDNTSSKIIIPSDSILYELEVVRNGNNEVIHKTFYVGSGQIDTVKLYY